MPGVMIHQGAMKLVGWKQKNKRQE